MQKTAVGVVCWVSEDKSSAKIISLKYSPEAIKWSTKSTDTTEIKNYNRDDIIDDANQTTIGGQLIIARLAIGKFYLEFVLDR